MTDTLVLGEALVDVIQAPGEPAQERPGGSPANVASGLGRLGHPVTLACRIGNDPRGELIARHLESQGVHLAPGSRDAARTPTALAQLAADGSATYTFDLETTLPDLTRLTAAHAHTGSIGALLQPGSADITAAFERLRPDATLSYDPNLRPAIMGDPEPLRQPVEQFVGLSDVVKASDVDLAWLYDGATAEQILHEWGRLGPFLIVVTRGPDGADVLLPRTAEFLHVPVLPGAVVDTVGAGDSFMAGLLSGLLDAGLIGSADPAGADGGPGGFPEPASRSALRQARLADIVPSVERARACAAWTVARAGAGSPSRTQLTPERTD